jgi:hypothetical protein
MGEAQRSAVPVGGRCFFTKKLFTYLRDVPLMALIRFATPLIYAAQRTPLEAYS